MSKCKLPALTLDDLVRIFEALPLMLQVCKRLADLPYYTEQGDFKTHFTVIEVDEARELANRALKKLEGGGT